MTLDDQSIRPFFLGSGLDLETLPPDLRVAIEQIVVPIYERYVLRANGSLEAATGASLTFLMALEILSQYAIGQETLGCLKPNKEQSVHRQQEIDRYLRLLGAKSRCANFLQRLADFRRHKDVDFILEL